MWSLRVRFVRCVSRCLFVCLLACCTVFLTDDSFLVVVVSYCCRCYFICCTTTDTAETNIRKEQFSRDQGWKANQRNTKADLKNVLITGTFLPCCLLLLEDYYYFYLLCDRNMHRPSVAVESILFSQRFYFLLTRFVPFVSPIFRQTLPRPTFVRSSSTVTMAGRRRSVIPRAT